MPGKQGKRKITVENKGRDKPDDRGADMDRRRDDRGRGDRAGDEKGIDQRPSVFSRLGNKVPGQGGGTNRGSSAGATRGSSAGSTSRKQGGGGNWSAGRQSLSPKRKDSDLKKSKMDSSRQKGAKSKDSPVLDIESCWSSKDLDQDDQSTLEKKREMLQRELERQLEEDKSKLKRMRSSSTSSSSSSSSSSSGSSSDSSSSSSSDSKKTKKDFKKVKKKLKRDSNVSTVDKNKLKKLKLIKKLKKSEKAKKKLAKNKKVKGSKEKKDKEKDRDKEKEKDSPKKSDPPKTGDSKPRVNLIKPGGQERDKFGFYTAAPVSAAKDETPERKFSKTPEKRERKKSSERSDRKKDVRRESPKRGISKDKKNRDATPEKSPRRSPDKKRSPFPKKSPNKSNRDRTPIRTKSPSGKDKRGGSRDRRDLASDRNRDRNRKDDDQRKDSTRRDEDRRREDRASHGSDDKNRNNARPDRDERGKRDDRRYDGDEDRRRRDDRANPDRRREDLADKKREEEKPRGRDRDWEDEDRRGSTGKRKRSLDRSKGQDRFERRRDWEDEERRTDRKHEDEGDSRDIDSRRTNWSRGESPRRGRGGRGKRGRAERRAEFDRSEDGWKKGRQGAGAKKRKTSGKKEGSRPKSRQKSGDKTKETREGSPEEKSGENSPEKVEKEKEKVEEEDPVDNEAVEDKGPEEKEVEEKEDHVEGLVEDFSDIGESDDEILNQEDEKGESRPDSQVSNKSGKLSRNDEDLEDGGDVLQNLENNGKPEDRANEPEIGKENAKIADALGVDWSQLICGEEKRDVKTSGVARKNWSAAQIIRRCGLSKKFMGEEAFYKTLQKINENLPEDEKVELLDDVPAFHKQKMKNLEEKKRLFLSTGPYSRALSARMDLNLRRRLNGVRSSDLGVPPPKQNTNTDIFNQAFERMKRDFVERSA